MEKIQELLSAAVKVGASDLHISANAPPTMRVHGKLIAYNNAQPLSPNQTAQFATCIMDEKQHELLLDKGEVDFSYSTQTNNRFRINVFMQSQTYAITARILNENIPCPAQLNLPAALLKMCFKKSGLILVTGVTGSGKSTTLASLINEINSKQHRHIITLEDPIEYVHKHKNCIVNQREVGSDTHSYPNALRAALRQDPDVILLGEMRDLETISTAVTAAETGHLVFSTLHTMGAVNTIDRIIDVFPPHSQAQIRTQLADVIECVVSQQLLPNADENGRVAAFEVMLANSATRSNIRDGKTYTLPSVILTNAKQGMQTMDNSIYELFITGKITQKTALDFAHDTDALAKRFSEY